MSKEQISPLAVANQLFSEQGILFITSHDENIIGSIITVADWKNEPVSKCRVIRAATLEEYMGQRKRAVEIAGFDIPWLPWNFFYAVEAVD